MATITRGMATETTNGEEYTHLVPYKDGKFEKPNAEMMRVNKKGAPPIDVRVRPLKSLYVSRGSLLLCYGSGLGFWVKLDEVGTCTNLDVVATIGKT